MPSLVKPNETIGDELPILTWQIKRIMQNCRYQDQVKSEWVQWVTGDVKRTSLKTITQAQAKRIIRTQEGTTHEPKADNWAFFDKENPKHKLILSLCRQAQWVEKSEKYGEVVDLERLSNFLKSSRCPINKPLKQMNALELEKIITVIESIVKWTFANTRNKS